MIPGTGSVSDTPPIRNSEPRPRPATRVTAISSPTGRYPATSRSQKNAAAILTSVAAAFFWDLDVAGYLPVGLEIAVTLVAGRGLGSLLRIGGVSLTDPVPGIMSSYD